MDIFDLFFSLVVFGFFHEVVPVVFLSGDGGGRVALVGEVREAWGWDPMWFHHCSPVPDTFIHPQSQHDFHGLKVH